MDEEGHVGGGERAGQEVVLGLAALQPAEVRALVLGLDSFGRHVEVERVGHREDRGDERGVVRVGAQAFEERPVHLDGIDGEALEIAQR